MEKMIKFIYLAGMVITLGFTGLRAEEPIVVKEDKILASVRKSISILPSWKTRLLNLKKSPFTGVYEANVEFSADNNVRMLSIFISTDSKFYVVGNLYDSSLDYDALRRRKIHLEGAPSKGDLDAPVTIVEFSDLQCSSCKQAHEAIQKDNLLESYRGQVRFVYKNYPLSGFHPWALQAAVGCMCAYRQNPDAFWKMQNDLYFDQAGVTVDNLKERVMRSAKEGGLNLKKFEECYDQKAALDRVNADLAEGNSLGVNATPTFFVNGRVLPGYPGTPQLKLLIDDFLAQK